MVNEDVWLKWSINNNIRLSSFLAEMLGWSENLPGAWHMVISRNTFSLQNTCVTCNPTEHAIEPQQPNISFNFRDKFAAIILEPLNL